MHHFVTEMCTHVHISVTHIMVDCGIFDALWDLWDGSIKHLDDSLSNAHQSDMSYFNLLFD